MSLSALALDSDLSANTSSFLRPRVRGKFLFVGERKLYVRGVTYGPFPPREDGTEYPEPTQVVRDFKEMVANGINAIRTYSVPPSWLLDIALQAGLHVMVGLPWEQHVTFLDDPRTASSIEAHLRAYVRNCTGHPAILCYILGNEIPSGIVRWLGRRRVEQFIERLYCAAKSEDTQALFTYVNYPTTEYLELPFLDLCSFNVYLESQSAFESYLARLQNLIGNRPLVMAEIGLDSRRNGEEAQANSLEWQIRSAFAAGCAGAFIFSWTDQWHRGGCEIKDWDFGLTRRDRSPKLALKVVRRAFGEVPFPKDTAWPRISVVVCTYNGSRTLADCFQHLARLDYPNFEVIVVDDGSTDRYVDCATKYGFRLIRTPRAGLSSARNTGLQAAKGDIVAYIDDDAYPDPHWLKYLAGTFLASGFVGLGGPNIPPPGDGWIADCVSNAPGGPVQVLLSDREAEHIPGCNMAFLRSALLEIGGFDEQFRVAGDDVDVCWCLQNRGWKLGFNPAAQVWHHRRNSIRTYCKQQWGYGRAEALLEKKWPEKYNAVGHVSWSGRVYGNGFLTILPRPGRVYQGTWGTAPFQRLYQPVPGMLSSLILIPEWYLIAGLLAMLTALGWRWKPLFLAGPLVLAALGAPLAHAIASGWRARPAVPLRSRWSALRLHSMTALLHLIQPIARLLGRVHWGLTPWRGMSPASLPIPRSYSAAIWSESWAPAEYRLHMIETAVKEQGAVIRRGGDFDDWDLEIRGGLLGSARMQIAVEEHGQGRQLTRLRLWPIYSPFSFALALPLVALSVGAAYAGAWIACGAMALLTLLIAWCSLEECERATAIARRALSLWNDAQPAAKWIGPQPESATPAREPEPRPVPLCDLKAQEIAGSWQERKCGD